MAKTKKKIQEKVPFQKALLFDENELELSTSGRFGKEGGCESLSELNQYLDDMAELYSAVLHSAWKMTEKQMSKTRIKSRLMASYPIKARVANSAISQAAGQFAAMSALIEAQQASLLAKIDSYQEKIDKQISDHKEWHSSISWHRPSEGDCEKNRRWKRKIIKMKNRLHNLKMKYEKRQNEPVSCCYGSRKLFLKQYHLEENGYESHEDWKRDWQKARNSSFFQIGSTDETCGNQICQLSASSDPEWFEMKLRSGYRDDKTDCRHKIRIPYQNERLARAIDHSSVSVRFVKKENKGWYIQPSVTLEYEEMDEVKGMAGIDINDGFLSVAWMKEDGTPESVEDIQYQKSGRTEVNETVLKQVLSSVFRKAKSRNYGVAIEAISLTKKKDRLHTRWNKEYNSMLSNFPYTRYTDSCESLSYRRKVPLYYVDPCYSSVLGEKKYRKLYGISGHQSAACVIANRALGFSEFYVRPKKKEAEASF